MGEVLLKNNIIHIEITSHSNCISNSSPNFNKISNIYWLIRVNIIAPERIFHSLENFEDLAHMGL